MTATPEPTPSQSSSDIADIVRAEVGRVHATLIADFGDLELAEDAMQDAFTQALEQWSRDGIPDRPGAWLTTVGRRRAIDRRRREGRRRELERVATAQTVTEQTLPEDAVSAQALSDDPSLELVDDQLRLLFMCCHPALSLDAQVSLTLRMVCGLTTEDIARLLLVSESAMGQRISRAKAKIRDAAIPFKVPSPDALPRRVAAVLSCAYLVFTEGYGRRGSGSLEDELCDEGVRLALLVADLVPEEVDAHALVALVLLQDARRAARRDIVGAPVLLEDQDRSRWDHSMITRGQSALAMSKQLGGPTSLQLQASIADVHASASSMDSTDWSTIAGHYRVLAQLAPSPIVELNRAVAVGFADGPDAGMRIIEAIGGDPRLRSNHHLPAVRGYLAAMAGQSDIARTAYEEAIELAPTDADVAHYRRQIERLGSV